MYSHTHTHTKVPFKNVLDKALNIANFINLILKDSFFFHTEKILAVFSSCPTLIYKSPLQDSKKRSINFGLNVARDEECIPYNRVY